MGLEGGARIERVAESLESVHPPIKAARYLTRARHQLEGRMISENREPFEAHRRAAGSGDAPYVASDGLLHRTILEQSRTSILHVPQSRRSCRAQGIDTRERRQRIRSSIACVLERRRIRNP